MIKNSEIISFLRSRETKAGFVDSLKIRYRPLICPFPELLVQVKDGDRVGDVGCGSGQFLLLVNHFTKPSSVSGVEITERLISNARELFAKEPAAVPHSFHVYNGSEIHDYIRASNVVFVIDVLHHVPVAQQQQFMKMLFDAVEPGTRVILKDINRASALVVFNKLHDLVFSGEIGNEKTFAEAEEMAAAAGFSVLSKFTKRTFVYPHYCLVLKKPS